MDRTRREIADLSRDLTDLVKTLAVRGETVFGVDQLPPPPRIAARPVSAPVIDEPVVHRPSPTVHPPMDLPRGLEELAKQASGCTRCGLSERRGSVVFGDGTGTSGLMLIGEGPGRYEDESGIPFVGKAGKLLDRITAAVGFHRSELYITNIVKCRPPGNRDPRPEEVLACRPYLNRQVEALTPRLVVAVGRPSAQSLLRTELPLSRLRGRVHSLGGIPVVVTYHPAYLLRSPAQKVRAWEDWRRIRDLLSQIGAGVSISVDGEDVPL
jgi:uracil-DNA glycosylase